MTYQRLEINIIQFKNQDVLNASANVIGNDNGISWWGSGSSIDGGAKL